MADSAQGIFAFDLFAQFDRSYMPQHPVTNFDIIDNQMHYLAGDRIIAEHLLVRASREVAIRPEILSGKTAILSSGRLIVVGTGVVMIYLY